MNLVTSWRVKLSQKISAARWNGAVQGSKRTSAGCCRFDSNLQCERSWLPPTPSEQGLEVKRPEFCLWHADLIQNLSSARIERRQ